MIIYMIFLPYKEKSFFGFFLFLWSKGSLWVLWILCEFYIFSYFPTRIPYDLVRDAAILRLLA
jgi:hypothetical protein